MRRSPARPAMHRRVGALHLEQRRSSRPRTTAGWRTACRRRRRVRRSCRRCREAKAAITSRASADAAGHGVAAGDALAEHGEVGLDAEVALRAAQARGGSRSRPRRRSAARRTRRTARAPAALKSNGTGRVPLSGPTGSTITAAVPPSSLFWLQLAAQRLQVVGIDLAGARGRAAWGCPWPRSARCRARAGRRPSGRSSRGRRRRS